MRGGGGRGEEAVGETEDEMKANGHEMDEMWKLTVLVAFPQFNRKYGEQLPDGSWQVTAPWQAGLSNVCPHPTPSLTPYPTSSYLSPAPPNPHSETPAHINRVPTSAKSSASS